MLKQGTKTPSDSKLSRLVVCILAAIAGAVDAAGLCAVGQYSSDVTGAVSASAGHIAVGETIKGGQYLILVLVFIIGSAVSKRLTNTARRYHLRGEYALGLAAGALLLGSLGCIALLLPDVQRDRLLAFGLSFLMGLESALVAWEPNTAGQTTYLAGMATDIGAELGQLLDNALHRRSGVQVAVDHQKLRLYSQIVGSLLAGAVVGALAYRNAGVYSLFGIAILLASLAAPALRPCARGGTGDAGSSS